MAAARDRRARWRTARWTCAWRTTPTRRASCAAWSALAATYQRVEVGDELAAAGDLEGALAEYAAAHAEQPDNAELAFWHGVTLAANGREAEARELLERAYARARGLARAAAPPAGGRPLPG